MATLGFAHTESVLGDDDRHERLFGELGGGWVARPWLQLSLRLDNRYDFGQAKAGKDSSVTGSPELSSRHAFQLSPGFWLAAQARVRLPSASSIGRSFGGATTELAGLLTRTLHKTGELTLQAGYRFDRTSHAFSNPTTLSKADAVSAQMSRWDSALLGALVAVPMGSITLVGEWSWEPFLGSGAPSALKAPMRVRGALQKQIGERLVPGIEFGANVTGRPAFDPLTRIEPRVWVALSLGVYLDPKTPQKAVANATPVAADAPNDEALMTGVRVRILDPEGRPAANAEVTWLSGDETRATSTSSDGYAQFQGKRGTQVQVTVRRLGMHPIEKTFTLGEAPPLLELALESSLPEGEIKGKVRSLRGGPLVAKVELLPTAQTLETQKDGTFQLIVPPGSYVLRITAPGHEPQERPAQVEKLGVTILVIDLRRSKK